MSLISGANFVAPLRSKVQIVGIFALAVLVAVLRLADSGEPSLDESASNKFRQRSASSDAGGEPSLADDMEAYMAYRHKAKPLKPSAGSNGDFEVDQALQGGAASSSNSRGTEKDSDDDFSEPKKLNAIVRSLERGGE